MFSISFGEMMVILVMGLLVIGPQRLPAAARFMGHLFGRVQRQVSSIKSDIKREMDLAELREMQDSYKKAAQDFTQSIAGPMTAATEPASGKGDGAAPDDEKPSGPPLTKAPEQTP